MSYLELPVNADPLAIRAEIEERLAALIPGWRPDPAWVALTDPLVAMNAETREVAAELARAAYAELGAMYGIHRQAATAAAADSTWTLTDTLGHVIEAGTQITLLAPDGSRVGFEVAADVTVPAGSSATAVGEVPLVALETGARTSGLISDPQLEDALAWVQSIVLTAATSGGQDEQDEQEYLDDLTEELTLQTRTLIRDEDFEIAARRVPGVERVTVVSGYNPLDGTSGNPGHFATFGIDAAGANLPTPVKTAMETELATRRLVNLVSHVADPVRTTVNVTFTATCYPQFEASAVEAAAEAAVANFLDPARWGLLPFGDQLAWRNTPVVRRWDVIALLEHVMGIEQVTSVLLNSGTLDVTLGSPVGLPTVGTISGTVS